MPRAHPLQAAFNAGEIGPRLAARVDFAKYGHAAARVENMIPLPQGGLTRRPGTRFVAAAADHEKRSRLLPFEFSTEQAYVLEAGEQRLRFFRGQGQIVVPPSDAAIVNGGFDDDIAGWSDLSEGGAAIAHEVLDAGGVDTLKFAQITTRNWGSGAGAERRHVGLRWTAEESGAVKSATIVVAAYSSALAGMASIWTDAAGSPGTQVGGDSATVNITASGTYSFTWDSKPVLSQGSAYWIVFSDTGSGLVDLSLCADQGDAFASGSADSIAAVADIGPGGAPTANEELRVKVLVETASSIGALALTGSGGAAAVAEQQVATSAVGSEHVLSFRVIGLPGEKAVLRLGSTSGGDQLLSDREVETGYHAIAFTPASSPFFIQFRNAASKSVHIDDVVLRGSGGAVVPLELATPYKEAELAQLKWAQSADVMYLAHPDHPPMKLSRRGNTTWSLAEVAFFDGPYGAENGDPSKTLKPSSVNNGTITASGHAPFSADDVGRLIRIKHGSTWGAARIREVQSPESVRVEQLEGRDFGGTGASSAWRLGAWTRSRGYPRVVTFFEQRTAWAGTHSQPQTFWMSQSGDLENMCPDSFEGGAVEVQDDDALDFTIAADEVNAIRWLSPGRQLILGTSGGEWSVTSDGPVVTPSDIEVKRESTIGSADVLPLRISSVVLFVQRAKRKLREFVFSLETDGFRTPDLTILADHITESGLREIAYQQEPDSQVLCLREDGVLAALTYRREQDVVGWSRHILGGRFGAGPAVVESLACIPGSAAAGSENRDEAWVVVKRSIDGATRRSIEVFEAAFEGPNAAAWDDPARYDAEVLTRQRQAFYVDSGLSYEGPPTQSLSGLDHLEGETVTILADGALHPDRIVAGGAVTLQAPASVVHVGLPYRHVFTSLKLEAGAAAGTALGKVKRVHAVVLVLLHSLGLRIGSSPARLEEVPLREVSDAMDGAVPLFTGERRVSFEGDCERDARLVIAGSAPLPFTLLAAAPELKTNELL